MTLISNAFYDSDRTGATETITLAPIAPARQTQVTIGAVVYNGKAVPVNASGTSFTFTVVAGFALLTVGLISPVYTTETVQLTEGGTRIATVTMAGNAGNAQLYINGN
jgi:hypothetical protein